ncbi:hypothetical protein A2960_02640 [Candidatus Gottesmanbacteria bacterium RIFCSPLOWO2_01_FULL_39_12b]|uniref:Transcriptional repressor PaaX-like central Cas2-like domain-containing protein n=1 Tax=Candidatus Gottesmanbacteria bacterium RIFCSPLOWO2_01_FULL_39_12b TaxID=1798388 RepID=A0A1F6AQQ7_9BACT|nr:MAG: hypothetical protein A2960_02640 [Candidatus Gottesmanbacteria bacterium RIFCSPLOWO2_01_FULL_39_12b]
MTNPYANIDWQKAAVLFQKPIEKRKDSGSLPRVKDVLKILAAAGAIGLIFAFPSAAPALGLLVFGGRSYPRWQTRQVVNQLKKRKYISVEYLDDGSVRVKITENGMTKALSYQLNDMEIKTQRRWDGKWRIVIFDISNKHSRVRDVFRMRLKQLGLYQFQKSVYVSPYPCFDEVEFLRELYGVSFTVKYILAQKIEDDDSLKSHFDLN